MEGLSHWKSLARRVALLGGTTTLGDCLVALQCLADSRHLVQGPGIAEYERSFARQIGVHYAYSFSAGRIGLYGILQALGIGTGDELLLQVPTHMVVANAIRYLGARPVYVDCRLDDYNIDLTKAEQRITPRTRAMIVQHTFGIPVDMDAALDFGRRYGLEVIEDCVHALGANYGGQSVGSFGRAAFFSTEETKTISSTMGGMVVTNDPELAARIEAFQAKCMWPSAWLTARYMLKLVLYHLLTEPHLHCYTRTLYELSGRRNPLPGPTSGDEKRGGRPAHYAQRLSNAQAMVALRQLTRLESNVAHRRAIADAYRTRLAGHGFPLPRPPAKAAPAYVRYPVWVENRAATVRMTSPYAVLGTWFTAVLEESASPAYGGYTPGSCARAEAVAQHLVNLPTHPRVGMRDVEAIVVALVKAEGKEQK